MENRAAHTKGTGFVALKFFVTREFGFDGWKKLLGAFPAQERVKLELPTSNDWYELGLWQRCLEQLQALFGANHPEIIDRFAAFEAERDLHTVQRLFLRMMNPAAVVEKVGEYWNRFCDFGQWEVTRLPKGATAVLRDYPLPHALYCRELAGYFKRTLELVGARNVRVEHRSCRARGDETCAFEGTWS